MKELDPSQIELSFAVASGNSVHIRFVGANRTLAASMCWDRDPTPEELTEAEDATHDFLETIYGPIPTREKAVKSESQAEHAVLMRRLLGGGVG